MTFVPLFCRAAAAACPRRFADPAQVFAAIAAYLIEGDVLSLLATFGGFFILAGALAVFKSADYAPGSFTLLAGHDVS